MVMADQKMDMFAKELETRKKDTAQQPLQFVTIFFYRKLFLIFYETTNHLLSQKLNLLQLSET